MRFSVVVFILLSILPAYSQDVYEILDRSDAVIHPPAKPAGIFYHDPEFANGGYKGNPGHGLPKKSK